MAIIIIREATTGVVLAQADETAVVRVENGLYFHPDTVEQGYLVVTDRTYNCPYRGILNWIDLVAPTVHVDNVAWVCHEPKAKYECIAGRIGFINSATTHTARQRHQRSVNRHRGWCVREVWRADMRK